MQRMTAPHWRKYPSAARLAAASQLTGDAALVRDVARLMAHDLTEVGIDVDCAPCLDLSFRARPRRSAIVPSPEIRTWWRPAGGPWPRG